MTEPKRAIAEAIEATYPQMLVAAGPGSGKTSILIARTLNLIKAVPPERIALVTYTNAAANEMKNRLRELGCPELGYIGTLHGLALRIARALNPTLVTLDEDEAMQLLQAKARECRVSVGATALQEWARKTDDELAEATQPAAIAVKAWRTYMRRNGLVTFDEMLTRALKALNPPIAESVKQVVNFEHLLVDEYQDSASIDDEIYDMLPIPNKFFVGDMDQCIFGFRGANPMTMVLRSAKAGVRVITVPVNHRSDGTICLAAANLIQHNEPRLTVRTVSESNQPGITLAVRHANEADEVQWLAGELRAQMAMGRSCAVLVRTNHLVDVFAGALRYAGVKVAEHRPVDMPSDWRLARLLIRAVESPENDYCTVAFLSQMKGAQAALADERATTTANAALAAENGLLIANPSELLQVMARYGLSRESIDLVRKLMENCTTLTDLLFAAERSHEQGEDIGQGAVVSTIHAAKGREWDVVYLPAFEQHTIPGRCNDDQLAEERRVAYVAMTRARHELYVSFSEERMSRFPPRSVVKTEPSRFITETAMPVTTGSVATATRRGLVNWSVDWRTATLEAVETAVERRRQSNLRSLHKYRQNRKHKKPAKTGEEVAVI